MKNQEDLTPEELEKGYHVTTWGGRESYTCITCPFATFDKEEVADHHYNVHILRPQLIEQARNNGGDIDLSAMRVPDVPLYDSDGKLIVDRRAVARKSER